MHSTIRTYEKTKSLGSSKKGTCMLLSQVHHDTRLIYRRKRFSVRPWLASCWSLPARLFDSYLPVGWWYHWHPLLEETKVWLWCEYPVVTIQAPPCWFAHIGQSRKVVVTATMELDRDQTPCGSRFLGLNSIVSPRKCTGHCSLYLILETKKLGTRLRNLSQKLSWPHWHIFTSRVMLVYKFLRLSTTERPTIEHDAFHYHFHAPPNSLQLLSVETIALPRCDFILLIKS